MVCGGCVTSLHKQFCMNKIKVYIMHIPSAAGWSFLRSVLYVRATSDAAKLTADSVLACSPQSSKNQSHVCVLTSKQVGKQFFYICTAIFPLQLTVQEACLLAPQNRPLSNITDSFHNILVKKVAVKIQYCHVLNCQLVYLFDQFWNITKELSIVIFF